MKAFFQKWLKYQSVGALIAQVLIVLIVWVCSLTGSILQTTSEAYNLCVGVSMVVVLLVAAWLRGRKLARTEKTLGEAVALIPWAFTCVLAAVCLICSGGSLLIMEKITLGIFAVLHISFAGAVLIGMIAGAWIIWAAPALYRTALLAGFISVRGLKALRGKRWVSLLACGLVAVAAGGAAVGIGQQNIVGYGYEYGGGYSSVDLWPYRLDNPDNILPTLDSAYRVTGTLPVLDGAEAAYPVYSAFAKNCYDADEKTQKAAVEFHNTLIAYERLLSGECDIFFGAQPSAAQREMAQQAGVELVLTPIGKEAFVFFVPSDQAIDSLSQAEIRQIYSGQVTNWRELGGKNQRILAFQRPEGSGSQTLLQHVMGDTPIMPPLQTEYVGAMEGVVREVASYRSSAGAIGYSFRFFLTGMQTTVTSGVKMLAIDGIWPDNDSIRSGDYPFVTHLYAITVQGNARVEDAFLAWMQGEQGQQIIEAIGYVGL